jgi:hypothetical protein
MSEMNRSDRMRDVGEMNVREWEGSYKESVT